MEDKSPLLGSYTKYASIQNCDETQPLIADGHVIQTKKPSRVWIYALTVGLAFIFVEVLFSTNLSTNAPKSTEMASFKRVDEGEPMLPYDELWSRDANDYVNNDDPLQGVVGSDCNYKMVYGDGTIRLYSRQRTIDAGVYNNWGQLWTTARFSPGGWGEPYWDLIPNYIKNPVLKLPAFDADVLISNGALMLFNITNANTGKSDVLFVNPSNTNKVYYKIPNSAPAWSCRYLKFMLNPDGNLLLQPYKITNGAESTTNCNAVLSSGAFKDITRPTKYPTIAPSKLGDTIPPTKEPSPYRDTSVSTAIPTAIPIAAPTFEPTTPPSVIPTALPSSDPTSTPSSSPTPSKKPTRIPTTRKPTAKPTTEKQSGTQKPAKPTRLPTKKPTYSPTKKPTYSPTKKPTYSPTKKPTYSPTKKPTKIPTSKPK